MIDPKNPEREEENEELRYWEPLSEDEVNDEELIRYKKFGVG